MTWGARSRECDMRSRERDMRSRERDVRSRERDVARIAASVACTQSVTWRAQPGARCPSSSPVRPRASRASRAPRFGRTGGPGVSAQTAAPPPPPGAGPREAFGSVVTRGTTVACGAVAAWNVIRSMARDRTTWLDFTGIHFKPLEEM